MLVGEGEEAGAGVAQTLPTTPFLAPTGFMAVLLCGSGAVGGVSGDDGGGGG